jgi:hypothetical protein
MYKVRLLGTVLNHTHKKGASMNASPYKLIVALMPLALLLLTIDTAHAWIARGHVYCDANQNREVDLLDLALGNVVVDIVSTTGPFTASDTTLPDTGRFYFSMPDAPDSYRETLDGTTLPADAAFIIPPTNEHLFALTAADTTDYQDWLIDSDTCTGETGGEGCRVTGGGNDTAGIDPAGGWDETLAEGNSRQGNGFNRYTFGGQAGANTGAQPQPKGEWTHHQQSGPDGSFVFHAGTASAPTGTEIDRIICSDEGYCSPARPAPDKQIDFAGVGTFKNIKNPSAPLANVIEGETYHWFEVHIEDLGEPGAEPKLTGKGNPKNIICPNGGSGTDAFADPAVFLPANCSCADFYRIRIYAGVIPVFDAVTGEITNLNTSTVIYEAEGYLNGGNLQIHPPTGFDLN